MKTYNYIILGAGASGLMLAYRMAKDSFFDNKKILIVDRETEKGNDRTWCYWEKGNGEWDSALHKSWDSIFFGSKSHQASTPILPYRYKMIRSEQFYESLWKVIRQKSNIEFELAEYQSHSENANDVEVVTAQGTFHGEFLFNSIPSKSYLKQNKYPVLQQHFLGWFIKTESEVFNDSEATFMDFSIPQDGNTRFMYVLPSSKNEALFEYTLFSKDLLDKTEYENAIKDYLSNMNITEYEISETEYGSIPMTVYEFYKSNSDKVLHIGTAGGWTKASTGYTFMSTTKKTKQLINHLKHNKTLSRFSGKSKFWFYDLLFLDVLANYNQTGAELFSSMFKKTNVKTIFKFLDEESSVLEDLKIILSVPPKHFITSLLKRIF